jgi:hypothetical protein
MRRFLALAAVAVLVGGPAAPARAHSGDAPDATAYRTVVTGISRPAPGLTVRTVEAGARLELTNDTGGPVEVLGYAGEPYLAIRPNGTWENVHSPATYLNETRTGETAVPATADPTLPPSWRRASTSTTVRWHDRRTQWLEPGLPPAAAADPGRVHHLRDWAVPLRVQVRTFEIRGTLAWEPPPRAWLWWTGAAGIALLVAALARRWPRSLVPLALIGGLAPLLYVGARALDGAGPSLVPILAGLLTLAAAYRHPPFYLALSGAVLALFGGLAQSAVFTAAVLPAAGPGWVSRSLVLLAVGAGTGLTLTGVLRLRAALPVPSPAPPAPAGLSSSA